MKKVQDLPRWSATGVPLPSLFGIVSNEPKEWIACEGGDVILQCYETTVECR